jgi:hypothetical protein
MDSYHTGEGIYNIPSWYKKYLDELEDLTSFDDDYLVDKKDALATLNRYL